MTHLPPGNQILAAVSIHQPVLGVTSAQSGFPFAGSKSYCPSLPGPCPGPNTVGPHLAAVAPTATTPPSMVHLPPDQVVPVGLPVAPDPNLFVPVGLPVPPTTPPPCGA